MLDQDAFSTSAVPGPFELLERGSLDDRDLPSDRPPTGSVTRGLALGLSAREIRMRWQALIQRLQGYRKDKVLVDHEPFWMPLLELQVPAGGRAKLRYEHHAGQTTGAALKVLGVGFGNSQSISISRSVELTAERSGKSFQWRMLATVTRYVDAGSTPGPDLLRVDICSAGGFERRVTDLPVTGTLSADDSFGSDAWQIVDRVDLSSSADIGYSTWTHKMKGAGGWSVDVGAQPLQLLGVNLLKVESQESEQFDVTYELPYGQDYVFYCRPGEWPIAPRCAVGGLPTPRLRGPTW